MFLYLSFRIYVINIFEIISYSKKKKKNEIIYS